MNNIYYRLSVDDTRADEHSMIMSTFNDVHYDVVLRGGSHPSTFIYEIYDKCSISGLNGNVTLYSWETQKHLHLCELSNVWITAISR